MILMNDFSREPEDLQDAERCAVERVLKSGRFILGDEVSQFETAWANYCGAAYAVGVGNGMDAIEIGLRALNIGPGDEVITTPLTAMATVMAIMRAGATPVLADISLQTALLDRKKVEEKITNRTKAVLLVHLYGQLRAMEDWKRFCNNRSLMLIEDCAQAHGATLGGCMAGTFGAFGAYSFYPTKNLGARGDGGALITDCQEIAKRARAIRNYGQEKQYQHSEAGMNSRLDEMQAAILLVRLKWLPEFTLQRRKIAERYVEKIKNPAIKLLSSPIEPTSHVYHLFVVRCAERDRLTAHLQARGIQTAVHYPVPAHHQLFLRSTNPAPRTFTCAEHHGACCLSIPCHPYMHEEEVNQVAAALNEFS